MRGLWLGCKAVRDRLVARSTVERVVSTNPATIREGIELC